MLDELGSFKSAVPIGYEDEYADTDEDE